MPDSNNIPRQVADVAGVLLLDADMAAIYKLAVSSNSTDELIRKVQAADALRPGISRKLARIVEILESPSWDCTNCENREIGGGFECPNCGTARNALTETL